MTKTILLLALLSASTISQAQRFDKNFVSPKTQCNTYAEDGFGPAWDRCDLPVKMFIKKDGSKISHINPKQRCYFHLDKYDGPDFVKVTTPQPSQPTPATFVFSYGLLFVVSLSTFLLGLHYKSNPHHWS